jgi:chromosome segregation ATPase
VNRKIQLLESETT